MGSNVLLGYGVKDRKLIVSEPEASTVRLIFRRYAELSSVSLLRAELDRLGIVSKRREGVRRTAGRRPTFLVLWLTLLAPYIVETIFDGRQPPTLQLVQQFKPITPSTRMRES